MSEELKSERVQLLMAPSELKAIDDWSFSNRIRSRGEAIRRLIERGLRAEAPTATRRAASPDAEPRASAGSRATRPAPTAPGTSPKAGKRPRR